MNYGVQIVGCCVFLAAGGSNVPLLVLGVVLFGVGIGNATSMPPLIAQTEFAKTEVVRVVALMTGVAQASYRLRASGVRHDPGRHRTGRQCDSASPVPHRRLVSGRGRAGVLGWTQLISQPRRTRRHLSNDPRQVSDFIWLFAAFCDYKPASGPERIRADAPAITSSNDGRKPA